MLFKRFWFPEEKSELLLHPAVSVLTNLTSYERAALIRSIGYIALGGDTDITPEVSINGTLLPLTPEVIAEYGLVGVNVDMLVTAEDIDAALRGTLDEVPPFDPNKVDVRAYLMRTPAGVNHDLDACREEYGKCVASRDAHAKQVEDLMRNLQDVERELAIAQRRLHDAKTILTTPASHDTATAKAKEPFDQQLMMLNGQLRVVEHRIKEYSKSDLGQLKNLLDAVRQESLLLSNSVAEDLETKMRTVSDMERRMGERGIPLDATLERYNVASEKLDFFTAKMMGPNMSQGERDELEVIHEEIVSLDENNKKHVAKIAELNARQDAILHRHGFPTWAAYLMAEQVAAADPLTTRELESARAEFKEAEAHWLRVSALVQSTDGYMESLEALDQIITFAKQILGIGEEVQISVEELADALRATVLSTGEPTALSKELESRLVKMGLLVPQGHDISKMISAAENFLEANRAGVALQELIRERSRITESVQRVNEQIAMIDQQSMQAAQEVLSHISQVYEEVSEVEKKKRKIEAEINSNRNSGSGFVAKVQEAQRKINDLVLLMAEHDYLVEHGVMEQEEEFSHEDLLRRYLFDRFAAARSVGAVGSVPLVFDDAFMNLPVELLRVALGEVARFSEVSQSIILTDDPTISNWALEVGPMQAKVISSTTDVF
jgi:hypothetical protein